MAYKRNPCLLRLMNEALIIFVKNPIAGQVKTRLAATLGPKIALSIYQQLLEYTLRVTSTLEGRIYVYYDKEIMMDDLWNGKEKRLQSGSDLGQKMENAFAEVFADGNAKVAIIGSDCGELSAEIISEAFLKLENNDVVIGPARDGGYYLLGMKSKWPESLRDQTELFRNKNWSSQFVLMETLVMLEKANVYLLQVLSDIDVEDDVSRSPWLWDYLCQLRNNS